MRSPRELCSGMCSPGLCGPGLCSVLWGAERMLPDRPLGLPSGLLPASGDAPDLLHPDGFGMPDLQGSVHHVLHRSGLLHEEGALHHVHLDLRAAHLPRPLHHLPHGA